MKLLLFAAGLLCLIGVARGSDDELLVREVVKSFITDYNNGDFKNAPSYTTDDWVHINPGGGITRGRDEVLKEVRAIHKTMNERQMKTYLVVKHNGKWLLALDQNTIISNP